MVQLLEMIWMLNELIQANEIVFMNFWYIEHYGASFGDDFDVKMNDSNLSNGFHELLVY